MKVRVESGINDFDQRVDQGLLLMVTNGLKHVSIRSLTRVSIVTNAQRPKTETLLPLDLHAPDSVW